MTFQPWRRTAILASAFAFTFMAGAGAGAIVGPWVKASHRAHTSSYPAEGVGSWPLGPELVLARGINRTVWSGTVAEGSQHGFLVGAAPGAIRIAITATSPSTGLPSLDVAVGNWRDGGRWAPECGSHVAVNGAPAVWTCSIGEASAYVVRVAAPVRTDGSDYAVSLGVELSFGA